MTTVAEPLSAGFMMMSLRARSLVRASRSDGVRIPHSHAGTFAG